jgi:hypothetical protein
LQWFWDGDSNYYNCADVIVQAQATPAPTPTPTPAPTSGPSPAPNPGVLVPSPNPTNPIQDSGNTQETTPQPYGSWNRGNMAVVAGAHWRHISLASLVIVASLV